MIVSLEFTDFWVFPDALLTVVALEMFILTEVLVLAQFTGQSISSDPSLQSGFPSQ